MRGSDRSVTVDVGRFGVPVPEGLHELCDLRLVLSDASPS
jgi:hypothetical protein